MQSRLSQLFFLLCLLSILVSSDLSTCPKDFTDEIYYTDVKERYIVSLKDPEQTSTNTFITHYNYLRDCMSRTLIYSSEFQYYDTINNTKISDNHNIIYIINNFNIYYGWFSPLYVNEKLSKMKIVYSAEKDKKVSINK